MVFYGIVMRLIHLEACQGLGYVAQPAPREPSPWLLRDEPASNAAQQRSAEGAAVVQPYDAWQSAERCDDPLWAAYRPSSNGHESSAAEKRPAPAPAPAPKEELKAGGRVAQAVEVALARAVDDAPRVEVAWVLEVGEQLAARHC